MYFGLKVDVWYNKIIYLYVFGFLWFIKFEFDYNEIVLFLDDWLIMYLRNVNFLFCICDFEFVFCWVDGIKEKFVSCKRCE